MPKPRNHTHVYVKVAFSPDTLRILYPLTQADPDHCISYARLIRMYVKRKFDSVQAYFLPDAVRKRCEDYRRSRERRHVDIYLARTFHGRLQECAQRHGLNVSTLVEGIVLHSLMDEPAHCAAQTSTNRPQEPQTLVDNTSVRHAVRAASNV